MANRLNTTARGIPKTGIEPGRWHLICIPRSLMQDLWGRHRFTLGGALLSHRVGKSYTKGKLARQTRDYLFFRFRNRGQARSGGGGGSPSSECTGCRSVSKWCVGKTEEHSRKPENPNRVLSPAEGDVQPNQLAWGKAALPAKGLNPGIDSRKETGNHMMTTL